MGAACGLSMHSNYLDVLVGVPMQCLLTNLELELVIFEPVVGGDHSRGGTKRHPSVSAWI